MAWNDDLEPNTPAYDFAINPAESVRALAGPGTGKSYGLQKRVARLLEEGTDPKKILAVTFTRTAARDLKNSINAVGVEGSDQIIAKTLHSFCFSLLNKQTIIESTGRYPRPMLEHEVKPMLYDIGNGFGNLRNKAVRIRAFEAIWARLQSETPGYQVAEVDQLFENAVMSWLTIHKSMLFGEMIRETYKYLRDNPMCSERSMFDHVLVDEYQDLNKAEQLVIDYLADNASIAVIGDDDQSIYSFKHAHPEGIREFPKTHLNCDSIDFSQCRRCPKQVVNMASQLISNNPNRTLGALMPFGNNSNGNVKIIQFADLQQEIEGIARIINKQIIEGKILPQDVLILVPVRKIGYRVRNLLVEQNVRAKSYFRESALQNEVGKEIFSMINLITNPNDLVAWRYLLGVGSSNYRTNSYQRVLSFANTQKQNVLSVLDKLKTRQISIPYTASLVKRYITIQNELSRITRLIEQDRNNLASLILETDEENSDLKSIFASAIEEVGLLEEEETAVWVSKVFSLIVEYVSFPQNVSEQDHVRIMSLHASKGLSAKFVVVMSCIDELIPRVLLDSSPDEIKAQIEEQRRLFYVAITRCKCSLDYVGTLIISSFAGLPGNGALQINIPATPTAWRRVRASRFISEFRDTAPETIAMR